MKFSELNLQSDVQAGIDALGFSDCTPIQESVIPHILSGKDIAGLAQTGTGKTAAYVVPLLDRLLRSRMSLEQVPEDQKELQATRQYPEWKKREFILVLVPTRELADQVSEQIEKLKGTAEVGVVTIYGGTGYDKQIAGLKADVDFVVGTPGRLIDLYKSHVVDFKQVRAIVFDEADRMFDMGFRDDMKYILKRVPTTRQFLVFSATLNFEVLNIAYTFGADPIECNVSKDQAKAENVKDEIYHVGQDEKPQYLLSLIKKENAKQVIIFSNFKHNVGRISEFLTQNGYPAVAISSLLTQAQRNRVMEQFKSADGQNILVATDLAARGLDITGVDLVSNYDLPDDPENYVHRIGRTGRAGREGRAFSLVSDRDVEALGRIEDYLKHKISIGWIEESEIVKEFSAFPSYDSHERKKPFSGGAKLSGGPRTGGPRGPRPDRGPRRDGPRTEGPRRERPLGDRPQGERRPLREAGAGEAPRSHGQHRDRLSGRHGNRDSRNEPRGEQRPNQANGQTPRGPRHGKPSHEGHRAGPRDNQRKDHRGGNRRYESKRTPQKPAPKPAGIGAKISGFFKGIFGK
ncbi:MAG: DEAD/DEAH box helicase [Bdellovibrionales bacterium]